MSADNNKNKSELTSWVNLCKITLTEAFTPVKQKIQKSRERQECST